jgi:hypothetical protein
MAKNKSKRKRHSPSNSGSGGGSGIFSSMRGGMKSMVGTGKKKSAKKEVTFWDVLFWIAAGLLGAAALYRFFS